MRKRLTALLLCLCMMLTLLPTTAYAAVGELLYNSPRQNRALLAQLEDLTGYDEETIRALLEQYGLLDENGDLVTDRTVELDGVEYTLDEIEELLDDPDTDLSRIGYVDGVPIALGDLQTIIAIERELQYLQETYFSGRTFEGEALENVNSLLNQLQTRGLTLAASSTADSEVVLYNATHTTDSRGFTYYFVAGSASPADGDTFTVKFKLAIPDSIQKHGQGINIVVGFSNDPRAEITSSSNPYLAYKSIFSDDACADPDQEYTLTYTKTENDGWVFGSNLYLTVSYRMSTTGGEVSLEDVCTKEYYDRSFGTLTGGVSFYEPEGFLFADSNGNKTDSWNCYFDYSYTMAESLSGSWSREAALSADESEPNGRIYFPLFDDIYSNSYSSYQVVDRTLYYLQQCMDTKKDLFFHIEATLSQTNDGALTLKCPIAAFSTYKAFPTSLTVDETSADGFPINLASGGSQTIGYDAYDPEAAIPSGGLGSGALIALPSDIYVPAYNNTTDTTYDSNNLEYSWSDVTATTTNVTVSLVDDETAPNLTVTAPAGTYKSGDLIPINIAADEYIQVGSNATVTINGISYRLSDLHSSTEGKFISFLYEVQEIDSAGLTISISNNSGITDFFGNQAREVNGETISGVELTSPLMKNAVEALDVAYTGGALNFTITASQAEAYKTVYGQYVSDTTGLMRLLITVDDGASVTHDVTLGEDPSNLQNFAFTAEDYPISLTNADQTVTVQLQVKDENDWVTVNRVTQTLTVEALIPVTGVTAGVADNALTPDDDGGYTLALDDEDSYQLTAAFIPVNATYTTGTWHSSDANVATISNGEGTAPAGTITLAGNTGEVEFWFVADNGTEDTTDDVTSNRLEFTVTAGNSLVLYIPQYSQDFLVQSETDAAVTWVTNAASFYDDDQISLEVKLYAGTDATGTATELTVEDGSSTMTIPSDYLPVTYPQSYYTVEVTLTAGPETRTATARFTVLSPPTAVRVTAAQTSITDSDTLALNYSVENNAAATATLSVKRMTDGAQAAVSANDTLSGTITNLSGDGTVTFTPKTVEGDGLYDTYTVTFTEDTQVDSALAPSTDSIVIYVYQSTALEIQVNGERADSISLSNVSVVDGTLPTSSEEILALRQELGLIEYVGINAGDYNWSSFRDGIQWVSGNPSAVGVYYRQGGLWDDIRDLPYETYLPQTQMAVSATADGSAVITATHAATGMSDSETVNVETLRDKFYLFQATPAAETTVTYVNGAGVKREVKTNSEGLLALYEPDGIASDVQFRSGTDAEPYLGTIAQEALSSGERDAAKLQLYPLNTITLVPAARAELYLVLPDGSPYANQSVTLRGGVYLAGYYCEGVTMRTSGTARPVAGNRDNTFTTDEDGKLTIYLDATQFNADGYDGALTTAALDYWFELRNLDNDTYYPMLVNVQSSMSATRVLRTGSAIVQLESVPDGQENKPYLTAQTLSYGTASGAEELKVRSVLDSTGTVGPNSTYQYTELTSCFMLWGLSYEDGAASVTMTGDTGYVPAAQTWEDSTFPFASIPVITNTLVLTKETMTDSGWLQPETAEPLQASVYQNDILLRTVTMPFRVMDLTDVQLVNTDASALVLEMQGSFVDGVGMGGNSTFTFGNNSVGNIFSTDIQEMLEDASISSNPLFKVLITPTEDNSVFNVLIWGGYNSLDLNDFDYDNTGLSMDYDLLSTELDLGVPSVSDLSDMAKGEFGFENRVTKGATSRTNSDIDFGAQLEGYYEGQFYYDTENQEWAFRTTGGGFTAGVGVSFQGNANTMVGPVPVTATFGASIALQLDFKAATLYTDQQDAATLATWTEEAQSAVSVNDYLTTLRLNGYVNAFGGLGFDYCVVALKIGLYGQLNGDSTNRFLSRTYLADSSQRQLNGQGVGVSGEVGVKFVAQFLFISFEAVIASGSIGYTQTFHDWSTIDSYWNGTGSGASLQMGAPTLLSRSYLAAYANSAAARWSGSAWFDAAASVVQDDANPGSEPAVNDNGSLSVYISDMDSENYFDSRIMAGAVGGEGTVIENDGHGDMSPSLSGDSSFTVAAWIRLFEDLDKQDGEELTAADQKALLNSTEIMAATTSDGTNWTVEQLTDNASPDLAPVTASSGSNAVVFWRSVYASDKENLLTFDTQNAIYCSRYDGSNWSEAKMVYNGSIGSVVGLQAAMLPDGAALVAFTVDRDPDNTVSTDYEMAYRVVGSNGTLGDLVVLTSDEEIDTNPQAAAVSDGNGTNYFVLGWYSTQDGGDICLQAVGSDGQLYSGGSDYTVPASVKAVSQEDDLVISSDFRFAKRISGSTIDGLTLVWAETENNSDGAADHSVLYGAQLCRTMDGSLCLSTPQALITLPARTLSNAFSAWQDSSGKVNAYIFGTWYDPTNTETIGGYVVPADTDQLLTGGGTMVTEAVSVDSIAVDYASLQTNSFTPAVFTVRNTGTAALSDVKVAVGSCSSASVNLNPGESASVTVMYKTGAAITNPTYTVASSSTLVSDTLCLDYNDLGISSMKVVDESEGKRTVLVTLYNDSAAKLKGSGRGVELSFYTDLEHSAPANVTLSGSQSGVTASGNTVTISGDAALGRIDQGGMTLMVTYDLKSYVDGMLKKDEVPASGVYLYASASVMNRGKAMAEYAAGNNDSAVLLTGAYARTGERNSMDVDMDNSSGVTEATVTLKNNSLQDQNSNGTLLAVLLDENGGALETVTVTDNTALTCEENKNVDVRFSKQGSDVILLYAAAGSTGLQLRFSGMNVDLDDFVEDADGNYVYTLPDKAPASTVVTFLSDDEVTVNGTEYDKAGSAEVSIPTGSSTITVTTGGKTYILNLSRSGGTGGSGSGSGGGGGASSYQITVEDSRSGTVTSDRRTASAGSTVALTVKPDDGYQLDTLTVTDSRGNKLKLTDKGNGTYAFQMPASKVTVEAVFTAVRTGHDCPSLAFTDLSATAWYHEAVDYVLLGGIMSGYGGGLFGPNETLSRAQLCQILYNWEGKPAVTESSPFTDVADTAWYADAVIWASAKGIVSGYGGGLFGPNDPITREQLAVVLWQYAGSPASGHTLTGYTDADQISSWAMDAMLWANENGILSGDGSGHLLPKGNATRAQVAQMIKNLIDHLEKNT